MHYVITTTLTTNNFKIVYRKVLNCFYSELKCLSVIPGIFIDVGSCYAHVAAMFFETTVWIVCFIIEMLLTKSIDVAPIYLKPLTSANISSYPIDSQSPPKGLGEMVISPKRRFRRAGHLLGLSIQKTPCNFNRCRNGGTCETNVMEAGGFFCTCRPGYYGLICDEGWASFLHSLVFFQISFPSF